MVEIFDLKMQTSATIHITKQPSPSLRDTSPEVRGKASRIRSDIEDLFFSDFARRNLGSTAVGELPKAEGSEQLKQCDYFVYDSDIEFMDDGKKTADPQYC